MRGWGESPGRKPAGPGHTAPAVPSALPLSVHLLGAKKWGQEARPALQGKGQRSCARIEVEIAEKMQRSRSRGQKQRD